MRITRNLRSQLNQYPSIPLIPGEPKNTESLLLNYKHRKAQRRKKDDDEEKIISVRRPISLSLSISICREDTTVFDDSLYRVTKRKESFSTYTEGKYK